MASTDPVEMNVNGVTDLVQSGVNKVAGGGGEGEGVESEKIDVLSLELDDEELLRLRDQWEAKYAGYEARINRVQKANKQYYLGKQNQGSATSVDDMPLAGNLIFEAEETFLPAALAKNPEPVVYSDNTTEGNKISSDIKTMLQYHADQLVMRRKLAMMVRQWSIYHLGVLKYGWDKKVNDIKFENRKVQDFVFDPDGYVDAYGDFDSHLGERITVTAERLVDLFPEHKAYIVTMVNARMGTECVYTEWWTDEFCFTTFKDKILDKHKNEFYKYDGETNDEFGLPTPVIARNHFARPKKPYTFLSVFSLGEQPHDITGLIEQNIPNQNLISERTYQIAKNLRRSNNSTAFSENNFTQQTAKQAANAFEKGNPVLVPSGGAISEAIVRFPSEGFPDAAYKELEMNKQSLRSIFGTEGITSQPANEETTARGMILNQQFDNTRIGGGIGDAIEQVADNAFNWFVQLYYVYYDEPHFAAIMGNMRAVEYVTLSAQNLDRQLIISVSPDSMKPKDEITEINQAIEFFKLGAIGPKTLLTIANFPNPTESAADGVLYKVNPQLYMQLNFPELAQQLQMAAQQDMAMQAQAAGMTAHAEAQGTSQGTPAIPGAAPVPTAPEPSISAPAASPALSNVPLPK